MLVYVSQNPAPAIAIVMRHAPGRELLTRI